MGKNQNQKRDFIALATELYREANKTLHLYRLNSAEFVLREISQREGLTKAEQVRVWLTLLNLMNGQKQDVIERKSKETLPKT